MKAKIVIWLLCAGFLVTAVFGARQWVRGQRAQAEARALDQIGQWSPIAQSTARLMLAQHGPPQEMSLFELRWYGAWPWKSILVRDEPQAPLEQAIDFHVPSDKVDAMKSFRHGPLVYPDENELVARSDREGLNLLSLNLAHDIASGKKSPEDADTFFIRAVQLAAAGKSSPYMDRLLFDVPAVSAPFNPYP